MTTSKASSSSSSINATSTSSKRLSGLISGLDTDTLVQQLTSGMQSKIDKQMQNKQIALWKQQSYRQVTSALTEFKNKYFSSSSNSSNISNPSFFNSTSIKNVSPFLNVSGNADVAKNMVVTNISQLARQASFASKHKVSNETITTGSITSKWEKSKISGASMTINYDSKDYAINLSGDFTFNSASDDATKISYLVKNLNDQITKTDGLNNNVKFDVNGEGKITLTKTGTATGNISIKGGSENLLAGLGLTSKKGVAGTTIEGDSAIIASSLYSEMELGDSLSGSTLTFSLNGVSKNITFKESEKSYFSDVSGLKKYLQDGLDAAFGVGKIIVAKTPDTVDTKDSGVLSFKMAENHDTAGNLIESDVLAISSSDKSGILGMNGALRTYAGESNRINTNKTLEDVQKNLDPTYGALTTKTGSTDTYGLTVNGIDFEFKSTDTINNIISKINNDNGANVTVSYSNINNSFSVTAKNGGASGKVDIKNLNGSNLANHLFGSSNTDTDLDHNDYTVQNGLNAELMVSFDGNAANATAIVRSDNEFTLDGVNFELVSKTDTTVTVDKPIKFSSNSKSDELYTKVKSFVDDYNALIELTNNKVNERKEADATYSPLTDAQKQEMSEAQITAWEKKAQKGLLQGDSILNTLSLNLRSAMNDQVASVKSALFQIGIAGKAFDYSANGKLTINEETLKKALNDDPEKVSAMFTGTDGIATRLQNIIDKNIKTTGGNGILVQKAGIENSTSVDKSSITANIKSYENKIKELKIRLETQQEQYYRKFTRLEQYLSTMNSQANWFTPTTSS